MIILANTSLEVKMNVVLHVLFWSYIHLYYILVMHITFVIFHVIFHHSYEFVIFVTANDYDPFLY